MRASFRSSNVTSEVHVTLCVSGISAPAASVPDNHKTGLPVQYIICPFRSDMSDMSEAHSFSSKSIVDRESLSYV